MVMRMDSSYMTRFSPWEEDWLSSAGRSCEGSAEMGCEPEGGRWFRDTGRDLLFYEREFFDDSSSSPVCTIAGSFAYSTSWKVSNNLKRSSN